MRVIFFGTPEFSASVLDYLIENGVDVVAVVTRVDKPKGRTGSPVYTPVKRLVLEKWPDLPVFQPEKVSAPEAAALLEPFQADLFVVVAYGEILKENILSMPKRACINLHTSLLPKYRGAAPIQRCLMDGAAETGVTIMHMVKKMDAGDMIRQEALSIGSDESFGELELRLCSLGKKLLLEVLHDFKSGEPPRSPQDETLVTFAPKVELEDCQIDWNRPPQEIHNLVRAVNPYPGAWCFVDVKGEKKRLKIKETELGADQTLQIIQVQLEGKRQMSLAELLRGTPITFSCSKTGKYFL